MIRVLAPIVCVVVCFMGEAVLCRSAPGDESAPPDYRKEFLKLCDMACEELNKEIVPFSEVYRNSIDAKTHHTPFFEDAYAVRALCIAHDLTGKREYIDAARHWADRVIDLQDKMIPNGAYYLNYGRPPGADSGDWWVADSGTIGMAVVAVAARSKGENRERYLKSARSFAELVIDNYVGPEGGITNGFWSHYNGQWWCSTATFGGFLFHLYEQTQDARHLQIARRAMDWTIRHDFRKTEHIGFEESPACVVFYVFEQYATGMRYLKPESQSRNEALAQVALAVEWWEKNQKGRVPEAATDYLSRDTYMGGMPYLMYSLARDVPEHRDLVPAADAELRYLAKLIFNRDDFSPCRLTDWELMTWTMMSYAEKLRPREAAASR